MYIMSQSKLIYGFVFPSTHNCELVVESDVFCKRLVL